MRPETLQHYRTAVIEEIAWAFRHVTREGGVSWSEAEVMDCYGTMPERLDAQERDLDQHWTELVEDKKWNGFGGVGGWAFLDPVGYRYYLPAAMTQLARRFGEAELSMHLTHSGDEQLLKWSAFSNEQCAAVARFLHFMAIADRVEGWSSGEHYLLALNSHWHNWLYWTNPRI